MKAVIEIRIEAESGPYVREVACVERDGHRLADIGLSLAESKSLLTAVQKIVVEHQTAEYLEDRRKCPHCGDARGRKGSHTVNHNSVRQPCHREPSMGPLSLPAARGENL
jgi:PHP family Zn ribbon phosphoesterase